MRSNLNDNYYKYYFSLMPQDMKNVYKLIEEGLRKVKSKIKLGNFKNQEKIKTIVKYVLLDNVDIFYVGSEFAVLSSIGEIWYQPKYIYNTNSILNYKRKFDNKIDFVLSKVINNKMNDYEKELAIHNYLVLNVNYDMKSLKMKNPNPEIYSAYGAIINRKAVCSGYANAAKLLLNKCGVYCIVVTGSSAMPNKKSYISHAWNIVNIKGKYYQLDVTWDSPINKAPGELRFDYFNVTDLELSIDHKWNKKIVPKCISKENNYFKKNNLEINDVYSLKNNILNVIKNKKRILFFKFNKKSGNVININKVNGIINEIFKNPKNNFKGSIKWAVNYNETLSIYRIDFTY
jgi:hypothetical protein